MPFISMQHHPMPTRAADAGAEDCIMVDDDEADKAVAEPRQIDVREPLATLDLSVGLNRRHAAPGTSSSMSTGRLSKQHSASMSETGGSQSQRENETETQTEDADNDELAAPVVDYVTSSTSRKRWTTTALRSLSQADWENMPPAQQSFLAAKSSLMLEQLTQKHAASQRQVRALKRANKIQESQLAKKQRLLDEALSSSNLQIVTAGKSGKRVTLQSTYAIGVRRNLSNISASDFGATVLHDMSRMRVTRAEVRTAAAILCRMKHAVSSIVHTAATGDVPAAPASSAMEGMCDPAAIGKGEWQLSVVSIRCDATNSSIWRREKLHVLDLDVGWVDNTDAVRRFDAQSALKCVRCLSGTRHVCGV